MSRVPLKDVPQTGTTQTQQTRQSPDKMAAKMAATKLLNSAKKSMTKKKSNRLKLSLQKNSNSTTDKKSTARSLAFSSSSDLNDTLEFKDNVSMKLKNTAEPFLGSRKRKQTSSVDRGKIAKSKKQKNHDTDAGTSDNTLNSVSRHGSTSFSCESTNSELQAADGRNSHKKRKHKQNELKLLGAGVSAEETVRDDLRQSLKPVSNNCRVKDGAGQCEEERKEELETESQCDSQDILSMSLHSCPACGEMLGRGKFVRHIQLCLRQKDQKKDEEQPCSSTSEVQKKALTASGTEEDATNSEYVFCQLCQKDLSHMNSHRRTLHINRCMDEEEKKKEEAEERQRALEAAKNQVLDCPLCGKVLRTIPSRKNHLKKCASSLEVGPEQLLAAVKRQEEEHQATLAAGILPASYRPGHGGRQTTTSARRGLKNVPKSKLDEDTQLALALSSSLQGDREEARAGASVPARKGRKNKVEEDYLLLQLTPSQAAGRVEGRVVELITPQVADDEDDENIPVLPQPNRKCFHRNKVQKVYWSAGESSMQSKMLWRLASLEEENGEQAEDSSGDPLQFYVSALMPPVEMSCVVAGSKIRRMSEIPGRCHSQVCKSPEEVEDSIEQDADDRAGEEAPPLSTQTAALLADLAAEADGIDISSQQLPPSPCLVTDVESQTHRDLLAAFSSLVNQEEFSDVVIEASHSTLLYAHRVILSVRCPALLQLAEVGSGRADLSTFSVQSVMAVLKFLYAGVTTVDPLWLPDTLQLCHRLGLAGMADICMTQLEQQASLQLAIHSPQRNRHQSNSEGTASPEISSSTSKKPNKQDVYGVNREIVNGLVVNDGQNGDIMEFEFYTQNANTRKVCLGRPEEHNTSTSPSELRSNQAGEVRSAEQKASETSRTPSPDMPVLQSEETFTGQASNADGNIPDSDPVNGKDTLLMTEDDDFLLVDFEKQVAERIQEVCTMDEKTTSGTLTDVQPWHVCDGGDDPLPEHRNSLHSDKSSVKTDPLLVQNRGETNTDCVHTRINRTENVESTQRENSSSLKLSPHMNHLTYLESIHVTTNNTETVQFMHRENSSLLKLSPPIIHPTDPDHINSIIISDDDLFSSDENDEHFPPSAQAQCPQIDASKSNMNNSQGKAEDYENSDGEDDGPPPLSPLPVVLEKAGEMEIYSEESSAESMPDEEFAGKETSSYHLGGQQNQLSNICHGVHQSKQTVIDLEDSPVDYQSDTELRKKGDVENHLVKSQADTELKKKGDLCSPRSGDQQKQPPPRFAGDTSSLSMSGVGPYLHRSLSSPQAKCFTTSTPQLGSDARTASRTGRKSKSVDEAVIKPCSVVLSDISAVPTVRRTRGDSLSLPMDSMRGGHAITSPGREVSCSSAYVAGHQGTLFASPSRTVGYSSVCVAGGQRTPITSPSRRVRYSSVCVAGVQGTPSLSVVEQDSLYITPVTDQTAVRRTFQLVTPMFVQPGAGAGAGSPAGQHSVTDSLVDAGSGLHQGNCHPPDLRRHMSPQGQTQDGSLLGKKTQRGSRCGIDEDDSDSDLEIIETSQQDPPSPRFTLQSRMSSSQPHPSVPSLSRTHHHGSGDPRFPLSHATSEPLSAGLSSSQPSLLHQLGESDPSSCSKSAHHQHSRQSGPLSDSSVSRADSAKLLSSPMPHYHHTGRWHSPSHQFQTDVTHLDTAVFHSSQEKKSSLGKSSPSKSNVGNRYTPVKISRGEENHAKGSASKSSMESKGSAMKSCHYSPSKNNAEKKNSPRESEPVEFSPVKSNLEKTNTPVKHSLRKSSSRESIHIEISPPKSSGEKKNGAVDFDPVLSSPSYHFSQRSAESDEVLVKAVDLVSGLGPDMAEPCIVQLESDGDAEDCTFMDDNDVWEGFDNMEDYNPDLDPLGHDLAISTTLHNAQFDTDSVLVRKSPSSHPPNVHQISVADRILTDRVKGSQDEGPLKRGAPDMLVNFSQSPPSACSSQRSAGVTAQSEHHPAPAKHRTLSTTQSPSVSHCEEERNEEEGRTKGGSQEGQGFFLTDEDSEAANSSVLWREENAPGEESTQGEATGGLEGGGVVLTQDPWRAMALTPASRKQNRKGGKSAWVPPSPFTPMPNYDGMNTPQLKLEVQKFGLKPVGKKRMKKVLKDIYEQTHQYETDSDYEPGDDNLPNLDPPVLNRQDSGTSQQPPLLQRQPQLPRTEHRSETSRPPPILRKQVERGREGAGGPPVLHRESEERVTLEISLPPLLPREGGERDGPEGRRKTKRGLTAAGAMEARKQPKAQKKAVAPKKQDSMPAPPSHLSPTKRKEGKDRRQRGGLVPSPEKMAPGCHSSPEKDSLSSSQDSDASGRPDVSVFEEGGVDSDDDEVITSSQQSAAQDLPERLMQFFRSSPTWHHKVLTYEALDLSVLKEDLKAAGIRVSQEKLLNFLDEKCITFTTKNMIPRKRQNRGRKRLAKKHSSQKSSDG